MSDLAPGVEDRAVPDVGRDDGLEVVVRDVGRDVGLDVDALFPKISCCLVSLSTS